ncbi:MAG: fluoride efflux transporter CrcB [Chloroflexota bacterium]|nr:fluoride efflux transporter CrcB [Chloroflexota bacterium]
MEYLWVGLGGLLGANARFLLTRLVVERVGAAFQYYGTFLVNATGSVAIGVLLTVLIARVADPAWRLGLVTGFLGGYTTFSSYSFEAVGLMMEGRWGRAALYVLGSNLLGLAGCWAGVMLGRGLVR